LPGGVYVVAEIGINHNGSIDRAELLIKEAAKAGFDAVKFQKRTVEKVYTPQELNMPRQSPFGSTNGDLKFGLEFGKREYDRIDAICKEYDIDWFASPWDIESVDFLSEYYIPYLKIASPCITDTELLVHCAKTHIPLVISTGMCTEEIIDSAIDTITNAGGQIACIMHCVSVYPCPNYLCNISYIASLRDKFPTIPIGYSSHDIGIVPTVAAIALGAEFIEKHVTVDQSDWGSDNKFSLPLNQFKEFISSVDSAQLCLGYGNKRILKEEVPYLQKLRRK